MSTVAVRRASRSNGETIARFQELMALETEDRALDPELIRRGVQRALDDPDKGFYLIAELDDQPVGSLFVTREWSDWRDGWFWWIQSVFIEVGARRKGVYRALHEEVRKQANEAGNVVGIRLYVEKHNDRAQSTYRSIGMAETYYLIFEEPLDRR